MIVLWLGIEPRTEADGRKLARGLAALLADDRSLAVSIGADGTMRLGSVSEDQMAAAVDRLKREFAVEASLTRPQIAYKEALTRPADGEMKFAQQVGGRGRYGHVKLHVYPGDAGSGYVFEDEVTSGAIPPQFITPIRGGIQEALARGVLHGYPIEDARVVLYDGSYHDVDSSEEAFRIAASLALRDAAMKAQPVLLEPIMRVSLAVPEEYSAEAEALLSSRGAVAVLREAGEWQTVSALVPIADTFGLASAVRARTDGRGLYTVRFSRYAAVSSRGDDHDRQAGVTSPLGPRTPPRVLRASVPEPPPDIE